ncbi:lipopolysaccharide biosynthesis protein [Mediterraneibacter sp. ICN-202921]|uniref:lipopolysaccharide biosynthesis protein n=1 Tax=Mediterraneibacter sp. ICN-202921 TaxID=3134657 RepID=UPI0030BADF44
MNKVLKFIKTSSIYFVGSVLTKLISFILLPLYSNKLTTDAFGYYDYSITIVTIVVGVACLEIWVGAIRFLLLKDNINDKNQVTCNCLILVGFSVVVLSAVFIFLKTVFNIPYLNYIAMYAVFYMLQSLYTSFIRGYQKNVAYIISGLLSSTVNFLMNIYFIGICGKGLEFLYIAFSVGAFLQIVYIESKIHTIHCLKKKYIDKNLLKKVFIFCFPLFINSISYWVLTSYSKVVIIAELGTSANGVYSMGLRFASAITLVTTVLSLAWQEMVFSEKEDSKKLYTNGLSMYYHLLIYAIVFALPLLKIVYPIIINDKYIEAMIILPICLLNTLCNAYSDFVGKVVIAENQTKWIFVSSVLGAVTCAISANILVHSHGLLGVVSSIMMGFVVSIMLRLGWLYHHYNGAIYIKDRWIPLIQLGICVSFYYFSDIKIYVAISILILGWIIFRHRILITETMKRIRNR